VWGIAGLVVLAGTIGGLMWTPWAAGLILGTGVFSLLAAITGYCVIGTALVNLGVPPMLAGRLPRLGGVPLYRMKTDSWYLERTIYAVVGTNLSLAAVLSVAHSPWWLAFTGFVGLASVAFAGTGFCPVANVLYFLGFEPRLSPDGACPASGSSVARDAA
jgi:hypothetical protein